MYWSTQEKVVFGIVFLIVFVFQISSIIILKSPRCPVERWDILLIPLNVLIFLAMVAYAKWVWGKKTWFQAFLKVILYEIILITLVALPLIIGYCKEFTVLLGSESR